MPPGADAGKITRIKRQAYHRHVDVECGLDRPQWCMLLGGWFFVLVLGISLDTSPQWSQVFAAVAGDAAWISAAGWWDQATAFVATFFNNRLQEVSRWIHTGHLERPNMVIRIPAWLSNFGEITGCVRGLQAAAG